MKDAITTTGGRGLVALTLASAMVLPLGLSNPASAVPTREVLLGASGSLSEIADAVQLAGGRVVQTFDVADAVVVELPQSAVTPSGAYVIPNLPITFNAAPSAVAGDEANTFLQTIDAPAEAGSGVKVAVIDTGVDPAADITVSDRINVSGGPAGDGYGHGTFMAGLVAGDDDTFGGVAPRASVVDVQVATADGATDLRRVLAGLQAVADQRASDPSLSVAMLALSAESPLPPHLDPLTTAAGRLWDSGVTVVVASGNGGAGTVSSPASDPRLLAVGAQDEQNTAARGDDTVPEFSAYGKSFGTSRPDLVAPGVSLISTSPVDSSAYLGNAGSRVTEGYLKGSGTSMSAAVAAGAVAALLAERPGLSPDEAKRLLVGTAYSTSSLSASQGAGNGGLDLGAALTTSVSDVAPLPGKGSASSRFTPSEQDAALWAQFGQAWADGDVAGVAKAWSALSPQTRRWAANAWSLSAVSRTLQADDATFDARRWAGRRWAAQNWEARRWATDEWVARRWADEKWLATVWDGEAWDARRWANTDWLAFAWSLRVSSADAYLQSQWKQDTGWEARRWANTDWVARRWADDAWSARRWAGSSWDARRWADSEWTARRWADFAFEARRWATDVWDARRWAALGW